MNKFKEMEKEFNELKKLAKPLQEWLVNNYDPMCTMILETDRIKVVSTEFHIPNPLDRD